jgi:hypothetical protein
VINGAIEHTTKLMELQWGHGTFRILEANLTDSPLHGLRKRRQNHRWCSRQDPLALDLGSESLVHLSTSATPLTSAWRQESSHCFVLRKPSDIGSADVEHQTVECGSGEPPTGYKMSYADYQMCGMSSQMDATNVSLP